MSVKLRLARYGAKKNPFYRIVVADSRRPRDGRFIEIVGTYDPSKKDEKDKVTLKEDRILEWLGKGAQATETVENILKKSGLLKRFEGTAS